MKGLRIEQVATQLNVSIGTINRWYHFKRLHPDNEISKALPDYKLVPTLRGIAREWTAEDVWKLTQFKVEVKGGRTGRMGKYGGTGTKNGKEENRERADA